ncbi:MAG: hypothetical protein RL701_207, partial [Pseudomonadota bacterium]
MPKSAWLGLLVGCGVALSVWLGVSAQREEQARALAERSLKLLRAPLTEAASYRDLRAREAREMLEEAQELAPSAERALLFVEARSSELLGRGDFARAASLLAEQPSVPQLGVLTAAVALARGQASAAQLTLDN